MNKFKTEKNFKIIDCDKNIGVCFIDYKLYNQFAIHHLNNKEVYLKLKQNPLKEVIGLIENKLNFLVRNNHISKKIFTHLVNKNSKLGTFRLLAKLHKDALGFRPIINCSNHPTVFLCLLIDLILQTFVKKTSSFLLDSQNLIQKACNLVFPSDVDLYTCDFESLYTNIDLDKALNILTDFISKNFQSKDITTLGFREILKLIFENNVFSFNKKCYKQVKGIAMGAKCAPSIANLFLALLENSFLFIHRPLFYYRFIDDIFLVVLKNFNILLLTEHFEGLKLNAMTSVAVVFLDLRISLDPITNQLQFSLYTKPTNTFSYLLITSNHPKFIFKNIPKSLFIRIRRICSKYSDYLYFANKLIEQLVNRGYEKTSTQKMAHSIALVERSSLLPYKVKTNAFNHDKLIFFKFPFDLNTLSLKAAFYTAFNSISTNVALSSFKFKLVFNVQNNLSSIFIHDFQLFQPKNFRYRKCSDRKCSVCFYASENSFIVINNFFMPIMANSHCKSDNILYLLRCKKCDYYYVGQSESAGTRLKTHIRCIRLNRTSSNCVCVMEHFNTPGHLTLQNFEFYIFKTGINNLFKRLCLESHLIHFLLKIGAILINDFIPPLYYWHNNVNLFLND
jgi:hypothetical protein